MEYSNRNYWITLFLLILFGYAGIHLLYLGRKKQATIYFLLMFLVLPAIFFYLRDLTQLLTGRLKDGDGKNLPSYLDSYKITRFGSKTNMMSKELNKTSNKLFQQAKDYRDEGKEKWAKFRSLGIKERFSINMIDLNELERLIDDIQYNNKEDLKVKVNELIEFYKKKTSYYVHPWYDDEIKLGDVVMIKDTNEKAKVIEDNYSKKEFFWKVQLLSNGKIEVYPKKSKSLELIQMGIYIDLEEEISELLTPNSRIDKQLKEDTINKGFRSRSSYLKEFKLCYGKKWEDDIPAYGTIQNFIDSYNRRLRSERIDKMSKSELKKEAKIKGLKVSGNKKDLSSRLK